MGNNFIIWVLVAWVIMLLTLAAVAHRDIERGANARITIHWGPITSEEAAE